MGKVSAGILLYQCGDDGELKVYLAHPGGPYFRNRDEGWWTVPKGLLEEGEDLQEAARREFEEEVGMAPDGPFIPLGSIKQKGGKVVHAWACEGDPPEEPSSGTFELEWPPKSGLTRSFPEIDRAELFSLEAARRKINAAQIPFLERLEESLGGD